VETLLSIELREYGGATPPNSTKKENKMEDIKGIKVIEEPIEYDGIKVTKDLKLDYKNNNVEQTLENLVLTTITKTKDEALSYEMETKTKIYLTENDYLVFDEVRGYVKPLSEMIPKNEYIQKNTIVE
jgi:hypothetical protein